MATFAQDLVASLTQPSYTKGLLTAGQQLGSLPRQLEEKKIFEGMMQELSAAQGDPATVGGIYEKIGAQLNNREMQLKGAEMRGRAEQASAMTETQNQIAMKIRQLSSVDATPEQKAVLESEIISLAKNTNDPSILEGAYADIDSAKLIYNAALDSAALTAVSEGKTQEEFEARFGKRNGYRYESAKAGVISKRNTIRNNEKANREADYDSRVNEINTNMAIALQVDDPSQINQEELRQYEQQLIELAEANNKDASEFVGLADKSFEAAVAASIERDNTLRARETQALQQSADEIVKLAMLNSPNNPSRFVEANINSLASQMNIPPQKINSFVSEYKSYILVQVQDKLETAKNLQDSLVVKQLQKGDVEFLEDPRNQSYFAGYDAVEDAFENIKRLKAKRDRGELSEGEIGTLNNNIVTVTNAIAKAKDKRRKYERSEPVAKDNAVRTIDRYLAAGKPLEGGIFSGDSIYSVVNRSKEQDGDVYKQIINALTTEYMLNPNMPGTEAISIIKNTVNEMNIETPGEEAFQVRRQRMEKRLAENEEIIRAQIQINNPNATEQELEDLYENSEARQKAFLDAEEDFLARDQAELQEKERLIMQARSYMR